MVDWILVSSPCDCVDWMRAMTLTIYRCLIWRIIFWSTLHPVLACAWLHTDLKYLSDCRSLALTAKLAVRVGMPWVWCVSWGRGLVGSSLALFAIGQVRNRVCFACWRWLMTSWTVGIWVRLHVRHVDKIASWGLRWVVFLSVLLHQVLVELIEDMLGILDVASVTQRWILWSVARDRWLPAHAARPTCMMMVTDGWYLRAMRLGVNRERRAASLVCRAVGMLMHTYLIDLLRVELAYFHLLDLASTWMNRRRAVGACHHLDSTDLTCTILSKLVQLLSLLLRVSLVLARCWLWSDVSSSDRGHLFWERSGRLWSHWVATRHHVMQVVLAVGRIGRVIDTLMGVRRDATNVVCILSRLHVPVIDWLHLDCRLR